MARILVVDDQRDVRDVIKTLLEEGGHAVRLAAEGREALQMQATEPAEVVITDLHMPGMNGLEMVRALRAQSSVVKIIAMTGEDSYMAETNLENSVINGADFTLTKPFRVHDMLRAIASLLAPAQA